MAAVITNYNIRQVTDSDVKDYPEVYYTISIPKRSNIKDENGRYPIIRTHENIPYATAIDGVNILKFGYCCEEKGILYPIYLNFGGGFEPFQIGKEGMYEMQPETWKDINNSESEEDTSNVIITGIRVPKNIDFTLDYVVSIN